MRDLNEVIGKIEVACSNWSQLENAVLKDIFAEPPIGTKASLKAAYSTLCINHASNASRLLKEGHFTSARALIRPGLDAYGRQLYISFGCNQAECDKLWRYMQDMSHAVRINDPEEMLRLDKQGSALLPFGACLVSKLASLDLPYEIPFSTAFTKLFGSLNSATHGGLSAVGVLLTREGVIGEPELDQEHLSHQISLIALRAMSLMAMLTSEERSAHAHILYSQYKYIVAESKKAIDSLPPIDWNL